MRTSHDWPGGALSRAVESVRGQPLRNQLFRYAFERLPDSLQRPVLDLVRPETVLEQFANLLCLLVNYGNGSNVAVVVAMVVVVALGGGGGGGSVWDHEYCVHCNVGGHSVMHC